MTEALGNVNIVIFVTSFLVGLSGALIPGPLLAVDISESARRGPWVGPLLILGHGLLEMWVVVALVLGMSQFLSQPLVTGPVSVSGGLFLFVTGLFILRRARHASWEKELQRAGAGALSVASGFVFSLFNASWLVWWATVGTTYVIWALQQGTVGLASFYSGHILADLLWYSLVSFMVARGSRLVTTPVYQGLLLFIGGFLILFSGYFFLTGVGAFI